MTSPNDVDRELDARSMVGHGVGLNEAAATAARMYNRLENASNELVRGARDEWLESAHTRWLPQTSVVTRSSTYFFLTRPLLRSPNGVLLEGCSLCRNPSFSLRQRLS
jgi:hypothetical protein